MIPTLTVSVILMLNMNVEDTYIPTNLTNFPTNWFYPPFDFSFYSGNTTRNDMVLRSVAIFMMGTRLDSNSSYMHIPRLISTRVSSCLDAASCVEMNLLQNNFDYGWGNESLIPTWNRDTSALPFMTVYDLPFYHLRVKEGVSWQSLNIGQGDCKMYYLGTYFHSICASTISDSSSGTWLTIGNIRYCTLT